MIRMIAECGVNWSTMEEAKRMIDECKRLNLFAAKFQCYNRTNIIGNKNYEFLKSIIIDEYKARELFEYGQSIGQEVFFTPMNTEAVLFLQEIGVNYYKVRYNDRYDSNICKHTHDSRKPVFISVDYYELHDYSKEELKKLRLIPLYCVPKYPAQVEDYKEFTNGISDHTSDLILLKECLKLGNLCKTEYWEKHVCLTKDCLEADWSVTFDELENALEVKK